ncbi:TetR/AcrR family transcriptional regulator [Agrobacterium pusense]|uniref:TetR/AcrR family transcriptional regulator n=1 Tax=Agrobacterium pusense TaxID=648995 RepID=UPI00289D3C56|nr:TetR/AcrR family transcriptional regulator [Agrobacterium pusense]
MSKNAREAILAAARQMAQSHGYGGLNFRDLASAVGIKAASIYYHFENKADLGAAVAQRYWEDTAADLDDLLAASPDPKTALRQYPQIFRRSLESGNRLCLGSFMSAEYDDLPDIVTKQVQAFADVNVAWLGKVLSAAALADTGRTEDRARAIFAAVAGAQLLARSRSDIGLFDSLMENYRAAGLLP